LIAHGLVTRPTEGLDLFALAMQQLDRLPDGPFTDYLLTTERIAAVRRSFEHRPPMNTTPQPGLERP